jgi:DNA-directed RNA polymerase specialized sigma24 family protein
VNRFSDHQHNPLVANAMRRRLPGVPDEERWAATLELCRRAPVALRRRLSADDATLQIHALLDLLGPVVANEHATSADETVLAARIAAETSRLLRYACRLGHDAEHAEDVLAEAAVRALSWARNDPSRLHELVAFGNVDAWLHRVVHNVAMDHHRRAHDEVEFDAERDAGECHLVSMPETIDAGPHREGELLALVHHREELEARVSEADARVAAGVAVGRLPEAQAPGVRDGVRAVVVNAVAQVPYKRGAEFPLHALLTDRDRLAALQLAFLVVATPSGNTLHQNATRRRRSAVDWALGLDSAADQAA